MINGRKNSLKYCTAGILLMLLLMETMNASPHYTSNIFFYNSLTTIDTIPPRIGLPVRDTVPVRDTLPPRDTVPVRLGQPERDTIPSINDSTGRRDSVFNTTDTFHLNISKDSIDAPVAYEAADSMVLDVPNKRILLYSKGKVTYKDLVLTADSIMMDQETDLITAAYRKDTAGKIVGRPVMVQGGSTMTADVIHYNTKSQRGVTQNTFTNQGEMFVHMEKSKKFNQSDYYGFRAQLTTCNLDTPHFAFVARRIKLVNKKLAVTGPIHPEFEGVPIPIYIPFGIFPLNQGRHSGFLPPTFESSEQFGLGLTNGGYYKVLNDYFDVTLRTNLYSYGGWSLNVYPTYRKRYRYNGTMNFTYQYTRILTNDPKNEYQTGRTFNIMWGHTVDSRARPGTSFSANVNAGSTKFNSFVPNNNIRNFTNQLNSSIAYSKSWGSKYILTATANHNQNNNTRLVNLSLPNVGFTVNTFYPFQKKEFVGTPKWYEKLGIGVNSNLANEISFFDSAFSIAHLIDTMQWGAQHNIPIQVSLPPVGPIQISPGINFQERWYSRRLTRGWNSTKGKVDTVINKGFYAAHDVSFSLGISTAIFGMLNKFGKNSRLQAIRHVIRPTFAVSYKPDLAAKDHYTARVDSAGRTIRFSYFDGSVFGPFSEGTFGGISFGIDNNIEAKIRSKKAKDTAELKKIKLIDGFGFNGGYNFLADSFQLSPISFYARSTLFEKINITANALLDPYQYDTAGFRKKDYAWKGGKNFSLGQITSGNIAISASFQSKKKDDKKAETPQPEQQDQTQLPVNVQQEMAQLEYIRQNPAEFVDFEVPWTLSVSYSLNFSRAFRADYSGFRTELFSSFNWNGDFSLTQKWKVGMNGYYDFKTSKIQTMSLWISREMHCWQMAINVTPVGLYRSFNITLSPKAGILQDLRVNRSRFFYGQ